MTPALHLVLVGSMGVGKTTIGTLVGAATGLPLVDSDRVLATEGEVAADIARDWGVDALHRREARQLLAALAASEPAIVAAAASTIEDPGCGAALRHHVVAWLRAAPEVVAGRLGGGPHRRDLGPDDVAAVRALAARRDPLYAEVADIVVDVDRCTPAEAARAVREAYEAATGNRFGPPVEG